jgi:hypothetical protein
VPANPRSRIGAWQDVAPGAYLSVANRPDLTLSIQLGDRLVVAVGSSDRVVTVDERFNG